MIRIAHLTTVDISLRYLLLDQLRYLIEQGYDVTAISAPGRHVSALAAAGIRHIPVAMTRGLLTPRADIAALRTLTAIMRDEGFTIVHTHTPKGGLLGQLAARRAGVPIVVNTIHGYYFTDRDSSFVQWPYLLAERLAASYSDVIFFQNEEDLTTAQRRGLGHVAQWRYLGNGIDLRRFDPGAVDPAQAAAFRDELGLPPGAPIVGFVGRLVKEKGILDLLEAMGHIRAAIPDVRLLIVGQLEPEKADAVVPSRLPPRLLHGVVFAGEREQMPELYSLMTIVALPSYREGFPRVPMEASAMGIPCVVSDVRGCRQAVRPGCNGVFVRAGDVSGLAAAIRELLADPSMRRRMGELGREMARERFDQQVVFARVADEYARMLALRGLTEPDKSPGPTGSSESYYKNTVQTR